MDSTTVLIKRNFFNDSYKAIYFWSFHSPFLSCYTGLQAVQQIIFNNRLFNISFSSTLSIYLISVFFKISRKVSFTTSSTWKSEIYLIIFIKVSNLHYFRSYQRFKFLTCLKRFKIISFLDLKLLQNFSIFQNFNLILNTIWI